jgi:hypothetical protein
MLDEPHDWIVVRAYATGPARRVHVRGELPSFHYVQALPEGVLLVAARCVWRRGGADKNAVIVGDDGKVIRRLVLGDGINDVRATEAGEIWVSYFDEGVFGNRGWRNPGPEPIGAPGLVCFDAEGETRARYDTTAAGTDMICDAYALNVDRDGDVWVYFYTEFPIVRVRRGRYTRWSCGRRGAHAIAAWESRALLVGGYDDPATACVVELRHDGTTRELEEVTILTPEGTPIERMQIAVLGPDVWFFDGHRVLALDDWC